MTHTKSPEPAAGYDLRADGTPPSAGTLAFLGRPNVLIARAKVRLDMARQDKEAGDTHAEWRNREIATLMFRRAGS